MLLDDQDATTRARTPNRLTLLPPSPPPVVHAPLPPLRLFFAPSFPLPALRRVDHVPRLLSSSPGAQAGVEQLMLGLYVIRGDNVAVVGQVDEELDSRLDLSKIKAPPLKAIRH